MDNKNHQGKAYLGIEANIAAVLSYLMGFVTGIAFYLLEKKNKFVRFHALQSAILFGGLFIIDIINGFIMKVIFPWQIFGIFAGVLRISGLILWVVLMIKAYRGEYFKLPFIGDLAEKNI